jgi:hypothetical protein
MLGRLTAGGKQQQQQQQQQEGDWLLAVARVMADSGLQQQGVGLGLQEGVGVMILMVLRTVGVMWGLRAGLLPAEQHEQGHQDTMMMNSISMMAMTCS